MITRPQRRGAEIFAAQLGEQLMELGHEVILISLFRSDQNPAFRGTFIQLDLPFRGKLDLQGFYILSKLFREINPDIVQANASDTLRMAVGARYFFKGHYQLVYRNANQISEFINGSIQKKWIQFLLSKVDAVVSVSEASKKDLLQTFLFPKPIEVIPIGIDQLGINTKLKTKLTDLPTPYLIQIGGLVDEKDPLGMVDIFHQIENSNLNLIFIGSGVLETSLRNHISELGLESKVQILSNQENIFPYLKKAKALVMPSKIEGLPGVILEAMYCQIPVVAYDVGGISEVIQTGKTGWLIPAGDKEKFAQAIESVLAVEPNELDQITENGKKLVLEKYTLEKVAIQFEEFYKNLLVIGRDQTT